MNSSRRWAAILTAFVPAIVVGAVIVAPATSMASTGVSTDAIVIPSLLPSLSVSLTPAPTATAPGTTQGTQSTSNSNNSGICPPASPSPTPPAAPTPTPLVNVCTLLPSPSASPPPTPVITPPPIGSTNPGNPGGPTQNPNTGPGAAQSGSSAAAAAAAPTGTISAAMLGIGDPLLAAEIDAVLNHPLSQQRPDLFHFATSDSTNAALAGVGIPVANGGSRTDLKATGIAALVGLGLALVLGIIGGLFARRATAPLRLRLTLAWLPALVALPVSAAAATAMLHASPVRAIAPAHTAVQAVATAPVHADAQTIAQPFARPHHPALPVAASGPWSALVSIESSVGTAHDRLAASEADISALTTTLQNASGDDRHVAHPGIKSRITRELAMLVATHQALQTTYQQSLQREYEFFVSAAQSQPQTTQLLTAASNAPTPVATAVTGDLGLVQTQLAQEAAIAAAAAAQQHPAKIAALPLGGTTQSFHPPVSGVVSQLFGPSQFGMEPPITYDGVFYPHFHTGLDIAAPLDTPLGAAAAGTVVLATSSRDAAGNLTGYGNYVVISHGDGVLSVYGHLDKLIAQLGQVVKQGQVIGLLGSTGWSTGPHVHFEIRVNGKYVDPAPYLLSTAHAQ